MDSFFGVSTTSIMLVLLVLLGLSFATVIYVILRNRIMFFMGLRNMPRRPAQTVLIIIGLMLSTLIISAALTTGDTVDRSFSAATFNLLGHTDEWIQRFGEEEGPPRNIESVIPQELGERLGAALEAADDSDIDGYLPLLFEQVPIVNPESGQSEPSVNFVGVDGALLDAFPDIVSTTSGEILNVNALASDEAFLNESAADTLATEPGDQVQIFVQGQEVSFTIVDVVEDRVITGVGDFNVKEGLVTRLDTLQRVFDRPGEVNIIAISNAGGVRDGIGLTDSVVTSLDRLFAAEGLSDDLAIYDVKRDLVESSEEAGNFMATFFVIFGLFSIASGMLLIVMIFVMLAAERKSELGMARAVGTKRGQLIQMFMSEGMAYNVVSAMVGSALGVLVAVGIALVMGRIFSDFFDIQPHVTMRSMVISYSLGVVLTFLTVTFASWRASNLNIVRAIRDIPEPTGGRMGRRWLATGLIGIALGVLFIYYGLNSNLAFPFAFGASLATAGMAIALRFLGLKERPVFTSAGLFLLLFWGFTAGNRLEFLFGKLDGDFEMFFLSGIVMVAASTFVFVHNADIVLAGLSRLGDSFSPILPIMRTAVAYPMANKFRTGMTLAMISLVIFALTMMSAMNLNFNLLFLTDNARGGWDVIVDENPNNPIGDLTSALEAAGSCAPDEFRATGRISLAGRSSASVAGGDMEFGDYPVFGVDAGFVDGGDIPLGNRARGFETDEAVWEALKTRHDVPVDDHFALEPGAFFGRDGQTISRIDENETEFDPVRLILQDPISGTQTAVDIIGVIELGASASFFGIYIPATAFRDGFGEPLLTRHFVRLNDPDESKAVAQEIEASLLTLGAQGESLKQRVDDDQALFRNFFLLMQGFMGLGLFVGIAAVGVIAFRSVVERRQQIGMLRAIGYKRSTVALSFMLESSFITLLGIVSGVGLALWLSFFLITSDEFPTSDAGYAIPWFRILVISGFAFGASLLMTFVPARQAASVPIAEALRYE